MSLFHVRLDTAELELVLMILFEHRERIRAIRPVEAERCTALFGRLGENLRDRRVQGWPPRGWVQPDLPELT